MKYIRCGTLIDATGAAPQKNKVLAVEGDRIVKIIDAQGFSPEEGSQVIDLSNYTLIPGMFDCHEHFCLDAGDEAAQAAQPLTWLSIVSVVNAQKIVAAGITTMRDVGEKGFIDVSLKRAIDSGVIPGPRTQISGHPLIRTGGHAHFLGRETDGVDDMRKAVREQLKQGVEWVKIMVSGGMSTLGSKPDSQEFSTDEIRACIDEAHRAGRPVVAHIHGGPGLKVAVEAGVDTVEHGVLLTEEDVKLMAKHGTWLVVTDGIGQAVAADPEAPAFYKAKIGKTLDYSAKVRRWAKQYGVKVALGCDTNHCRMDMEMKALMQSGWSPMEALQAATIRGAELMGLDKQLGTLQPEKLADIVAVDGDPLVDPSALLRVKFVMKDGKVVVSA